jgi:hypothetical protein
MPGARLASFAEAAAVSGSFALWAATSMFPDDRAEEVVEVVGHASGDECAGLSSRSVCMRACSRRTFSVMSRP